jgi:pyridinium-3,5-biscarboxylic acid mononucleotide sulfurtransferase
LSTEMETIYQRLIVLLKEMGGVLVAFSGGVDSELLLAAAHDALDGAVLAVTITTPMFPAHEFECAQKFASHLGVRWTPLAMDALDDEQFTTNPPNRCYVCKKKLFLRLIEKAREEGLPFVIEATNADDLSDFRPGIVALRELAIRSPFLDLGIRKQDIRRLSKKLGLENWDKPSSACLASRIPYGEEITRERLERIGNAEASLHQLGFRQVRVRDHGPLGRIELIPEDINRLLGTPLCDAIVEVCKAAGYHYVTLDLQGYRTGSMNETLEATQRQP